MERKPLVVACRFILLAVASVLLYYGLAMLLLVPGVPGGPYWEKARVAYGVVPVLSGLLTLAASAWAAARYRTQEDRVETVIRTLVYAAVGVVLVFVSAIVNDLYIHVPIDIR